MSTKEKERKSTASGAKGNDSLEKNVRMLLERVQAHDSEIESANNTILFLEKELKLTQAREQMFRNDFETIKEDFSKAIHLIANLEYMVTKLQDYQDQQQKLQQHNKEEKKEEEKEELEPFISESNNGYETHDLNVKEDNYDLVVFYDEGKDDVENNKEEKEIKKKEAVVKPYIRESNLYYRKHDLNVKEKDQNIDYNLVISNYEGKDIKKPSKGFFYRLV